MKITVIAFTQNGAAAAKQLVDGLSGARGYVFHKYSAGGLEPFCETAELVGEKFCDSDALVFVGACGIAVRTIAPHIKSKTKDPAVLVMDERKQFVIPILSGHIGGANELARSISKITGARAVVTTATDVNGAFSVDTFAVKNNLYIADMDMAKLVSAEILEGHKIGIYSDFEMKNIPDCFTKNAELGVCISHDMSKKPFRKTLNLIPQNIVIGIGCKRGISDVTEFCEKFLGERKISPHAVCAVTSVDLKKDEQAILNLCSKYEIPFKTYSASELMAQNGDFTASEFVKNAVGADNVCERSVVARGAELMVKKTAENGVTLAMGALNFKIDFNEG